MNGVEIHDVENKDTADNQKIETFAKYPKIP